MANDGDIAQLPKWGPIRRRERLIKGKLLRGIIAALNNFADGKKFRNPMRMPISVEGGLLSAKDLHGLDLSGVNLHVCNFVRSNLIGANLSGANMGLANFEGANLSGANLSGANLVASNLMGANLTGANLSGANIGIGYLIGANLSGANFSGANLSGAFLLRANLTGTNLSRANLKVANLQTAIMIDTILSGADLTGCRIYGISTWNLRLEQAKQQNLVLTKRNEPEITVDNIEVAQFIHLLLHNEKIRHVIDTVTSKVVLILGRFTPERKAVLDALREELRQRDYLPILFDFEQPASRDITETISLLARMARFVLADITDAKSIPQELNVIVPHLPSVPVQPLLLRESSEYGMFEHYMRYPWVLPIHRYDTQSQLITDLGERVIKPAERMAFELRTRT
jgi:uncharacterized protein YjbI with pentapeptide repeats